MISAARALFGRCQPRRARAAELLEILRGMIGGARERRRRDHQEALAVGHVGIGLELLRRHEPVERMMLRRRLEVLADGEEIDIGAAQRSEEHTSELQSLMRISYAVFCLK